MKEYSRTESVLVALRRIIRAVDLHSRQLITRQGVTGPQLVLLKELQRQQCLSIRELTRSIHLSQATVTGIIDRLEKKQLVIRCQSQQDRRRVTVQLTEAGENLLRQAPPMMQETFVAAFEKLQDWEQTQILSSLQRVVAMMEAEELGSTPMLTGEAIETDAEHRPTSNPEDMQDTNGGAQRH